MRFEDFDPKKHDLDRTAELLFRTDETLYTILFGDKEKTLTIFKRFLKHDDKKTYFAAPYLKCVFDDDRFVGIVSAYQGCESARLERKTLKAALSLMGPINVIKRVFAYRKVHRVTRIKMPDNALYVLNLAIDEKERKKGYGEAVIDRLNKEYDTIYLHVNYKNYSGRRFYKKIGFTKDQAYYDCHKNEPIGAIVMKRTKSGMRNNDEGKN